ncbi:AAA domain-containing protein [Cellulomonas bogoriensis]
MFLLDDGTVVHGAADLTAAARCEYALARVLDVLLGWTDPLELPADATEEPGTDLGGDLEALALADHLDRYGRWRSRTGHGVAQILTPAPEDMTSRNVLEAKHTETVAVLHAGADVVHGATFFDGAFLGRADFLVRRRSTVQGPARYAPHDTRMSRHAKVVALLQLAAHADQLLTAGFHHAEDVHLVLGDLSTTHHRVADLLPLYRARRRRLADLVRSRTDAQGPAAWGDARYRACGTCAVCRPEVELRGEVLLVHGPHDPRTARLRAAGLTTLELLAAADDPVPGLEPADLRRARARARLLLAPDASPAPLGDGGWGGGGWAGSAPHRVEHAVVAPEVLATIPPADPGDLMLQTRADPQWAERRSSHWGLTYLVTMVTPTSSGPGTGIDPDGMRTAASGPRTLWAHDRAQERQLLLDVVEHLDEQCRRHPGMHVYHFGPHVPRTLRALAGRHGVGEEVVTRLTRDGVLVDLEALTRAAVVTGQPTETLEDLEPLHMPSARSGRVPADPVLEYAEACTMRDNGDVSGWDQRLAEIAADAVEDCWSVRGLRDWLTGLVPGHDVAPAPSVAADPTGGHPAQTGPAPEQDALTQTCLFWAGSPTGPRSPDQQAWAMLAAALGYHRRENAPTAGAGALRQLAGRVVAHAPRLPEEPAVDLLLRRRPRTRSGHPLPEASPGTDVDLATLLAGLNDLDRSYLAIQGTPGAGAGDLVARAVAALARQGDHIALTGPTARSVDRLRSAVVAAGGPSTPGAPVWDVADGALGQRRPDVLVVADAGQVPLAGVLAVADRADRLLLVGDHGRLPPQAHGHHPEPVDRSALEWLAEGHRTVPSGRGYLLARSRTLHPRLRQEVSALAYDDRLAAPDQEDPTDLDGTRPGVLCVPVTHEGCTTSSPAEARAVTDQVVRLLGRRWRHGDVDRPLAAQDVAVVATHPEQVEVVARTLAAAGFADVPVLTVEEAQEVRPVVVVLTTATSTARDATGGVGRALDRRRVAAALARARWGAVVVRSAGLADHLPTTPEDLTDLGAFLGLGETDA